MHRSKFSTTDLDQLERQLDGWRQSQSQYSRLPKEAWAAATALARELGVSPVAQRLGLGYNKLKHLSAPAAALARRGTKAADFVEVQLGDWGSGPGNCCRVELSDGAGGRMTVDLPADSPAVVGLAQGFWRRGQ